MNCGQRNKEISGKDESDWFNPKYLYNSHSSSCHCLKDTLDHYGIEFIVKTKYGNIMKHGLSMVQEMDNYQVVEMQIL